MLDKKRLRTSGLGFTFWIQTRAIANPIHSQPNFGILNLLPVEFRKFHPAKLASANDVAAAGVLVLIPLWKGMSGADTLPENNRRSD